MSQPNTNGMRSLSAVVLTWGFAFLPANLIPTIIARLVNDFDMSVGFAGALATTMTLVNSATVLLVRPWVRRHSRAPVAAMGIVVLIAVAATGMAIPSATAFTLLLIIAGLGSGLVLGAAEHVNSNGTCHAFCSWLVWRRLAGSLIVALSGNFGGLGRRLKRSGCAA